MIEALPYYIEGIKNKDRIVLSKAITLVESTVSEHRKIAKELIDFCFKSNKRAKRIGITGSPGVGKSTFVNALGTELIKQNRSLAILAIDPSSKVTRGSILGDKTRMYEIAYDKNVFIRPTASGTQLGGIAQNTFETILLCEAFGFEYIIVETVGVGQSEIDIKYLTDIFLLLILPNSGDELQGIKRGVMELADIIVINKADKSNQPQAKISAAQIKSILPLLNYNNKNWQNVVLQVSSIEKTGIETVLNYIENYFLKVDIDDMRKGQLSNWKNNMVNNLIKEKIYSNTQIQQLIQQYLAKEGFLPEYLDEIAAKIDLLLK